MSSIMPVRSGRGARHAMPKLGTLCRLLAKPGDRSRQNGCACSNLNWAHAGILRVLIPAVRDRLTSSSRRAPVLRETSQWSSIGARRSHLHSVRMSACVALGRCVSFRPPRRSRPPVKPPHLFFARTRATFLKAKGTLAPRRPSSRPDSPNVPFSPDAQDTGGAYTRHQHGGIASMRLRCLRTVARQPSGVAPRPFVLAIVLSGARWVGRAGGDAAVHPRIDRRR